MNAATESCRLGECPVDYARKWARYLPERPALVFGDQATSYGRLDARADALAAWLTGPLGARRGDRVALLAANHPFFFELTFACLRAGLVLAPINTRLAAREVAQLLELAEPAVLFADARHRARADQARPHGLKILSVEEAVAADLPAPSGSARSAWRPLEWEETAYLLFTSGTTGLPKAAELPVRQLFWNAENTQLAWELRRDDATVLYTPLFHTGAINVLAFPLLAQGGLVVIHDGFDANAILDDTRTYHATVLFGVPTTFQMLDALAPGDVEGHPGLEAAFGSVRMVVCGGAPLPIALIERYRERGVTLLQGFGMTEVGPNCFYLPREHAFSKAGSVGKPMPYVQAQVRVGDREAGVGEVGELCLGGPQVCKGYFRNPEATRKALVDGWFLTGDLAKVDADGFFTIAGRQKDMFISGGENVYPAEIEGALAAHPAVRESAVVAVPDPRWGEVGCAFVVLEGEVAEGELATFLQARLARYKVPRRFVQVPELPRNSSGKVQKAVLADEARTLQA